MPTIIADLVEDASDGIPMDGYEIDKLPKPKKEKILPKKKLEDRDLDLPLQEHDFINDGTKRNW